MQPIGGEKKGVWRRRRGQGGVGGPTAKGESNWRGKTGARKAGREGLEERGVAGRRRGGVSGVF